MKYVSALGPTKKVVHFYSYLGSESGSELFFVKNAHFYKELALSALSLFHALDVFTKLGLCNFFKL